MKLTKKEISLLEVLHNSVVRRDDLLDVDVSLWHNAGLISQDQGGYRIGETGILQLLHDRGKKANPDVKKLWKIKTGNPQYFRADLTSRGFVDYPFLDLVKYQGYWTAMKTAYRYFISSKREMRVSKLTKDWKKTVGDLICFELVINDTDKLEFYSNKKGKLIGVDDVDYRTFKMELEPECESLKISYQHKFSLFNTSTEWLLNSEIINPMQSTKLDSLLGRGKGE